VSPAFALLGSGEFEPWSDEVDYWLLERTSNPGGPVLILPTASAPEGGDVFRRWGEMGMTHFTATGIQAEVLPLMTREDAERPEVVGKLGTAAVTYFSGGNPAYLVHTLTGTSFWRALLDGIARGVAYAGCSAGISCLGELAPDNTGDPRRPGIWSPGLALFPKVVFGPHWDMLDTYVPGLTRYIVDAVPADCRLVGVDEHTAILGDGVNWQVAGLGHGRLRQGGRWRTWSPGERFVAPLLATTSS
jgi:cyanophycinase-like exopeptidase